MSRGQSAQLAVVDGDPKPRFANFAVLMGNVAPAAQALTQGMQVIGEHIARALAGARR